MFTGLIEIGSVKWLSFLSVQPTTFVFIIITSVAEPEPQHDTDPASTVPALNVNFNIGRLSKKSQTITISYFSCSILYQFQSEENKRKNCSVVHDIVSESHEVLKS
jgi:hypothetical protein